MEKNGNSSKSGNSQISACRSDKSGGCRFVKLSMGCSDSNSDGGGYSY